MTSTYSFKEENGCLYRHGVDRELTTNPEFELYYKLQDVEEELTKCIEAIENSGVDYQEVIDE